MIDLAGKTVFITGASAGIGKACAEILASQKARLIITGRRIELLEKIADSLGDKYSTEILPFKLDVRDREHVEQCIKTLPPEWQSIDILINNAGLARGITKIYEDSVDGWEEVIDTNIKGLLYVTRSIVPGMVAKGSGHIINIGSIAGHEPYPGGAVYCATKHAVNAITKSLRMDLVDTKLRVTTIDPGMVETDFSTVRFYGDKEKAANVYRGMTPLVAEDIADAVLFAATRPPHVTIAEIILFPTGQASATIVHRE